jgi:hypothetical protein
MASHSRPQREYGRKQTTVIYERVQDVQILQLINSLFSTGVSEVGSVRPSHCFHTSRCFEGWKQTTRQIELQRWEVDVSNLFACVKA